MYCHIRNRDYFTPKNHSTDIQTETHKLAVFSSSHCNFKTIVTINTSHVYNFEFYSSHIKKKWKETDEVDSIFS